MEAVARVPGKFPEKLNTCWTMIILALLLLTSRRSMAREDALPVLREFSFPPEVTLGEHILVSCAVKKGATGLHHMTWLKDGKDIENSDRVSVLAHFSDGVTLRIANLRPEDVGNYTCVARNSFGSDSFTAPLVVQGNFLVKQLHAPEPQTSGFQPNLALGDDAIASCFVPKASWHGEGLRMTWTKENDGDDLSANGRVSFLRASKSSITLGISDVRREDIGNYTCAVFYGASTASVTVPLTISEPPKIKEFKFPGNLSPGDTVAVSCVVKKGSAGPFELFWMKDGIPVELTASVAVSSHKGGPLSTLSIVDVSGEHSGNYTCVARNAAGSDEYSAHLAVTVSLGEEIVATCSVKKGSTGPYALTWLKGGAPLENSGHVTVSFTASATSLSIGGVRVDDVGNYTCKAANSFGSDTLTLPLLIAGPVGMACYEDQNKTAARHLDTPNWKC
ncbi:hemicentin-1-like [Dermacentor silvarum]|uniref:hemicentin-1-like n=1 Tax=Dermacentor silvarum TaxID=543639 RepID=UPI0021018847|nr:hemicentin-1-like [Dermacentor silvarum]